MRASYVTQGHASILVIDLSGLTRTGDVVDVTNEAMGLAQSSEQPGSLLTLIDLTGTSMSQATVASLKRLSQSNGKYARATAFVGVRLLWNVMLSTFFTLRGKANHRVFHRRSEALAWLAIQ